MTTEFFGKYGPGPNASYEKDPIGSTIEFLEFEARKHRAEEKASRTWRKNVEREEAERFEAFAHLLKRAQAVL